MELEIGQPVRAKVDILDHLIGPSPEGVTSMMLVPEGEMLEFRGASGNADWPLLVGVAGDGWQFMVSEDEIELAPKALKEGE